jgi:hypothetical protein
MIPAFERAKTVHVSHCAAAVYGNRSYDTDITFRKTNKIDYFCLKSTSIATKICGTNLKLVNLYEFVRLN